MSEIRTRTLAVTEDLVRAYSRRANFHSDPAISRDLHLPGLVAQGVQAAGPAYGLLLDAWGDDFLAHGEIEMRFVGVVLAGDTVEARVAFEDGNGDDGNGDDRSFDGEASFEVVNTTAPRTAVIGRARRRSERP